MMKALISENIDNTRTLEIIAQKTLLNTPLAPDEVLIEMHYAPLNPLDLYLLYRNHSYTQAKHSKNAISTTSQHITPSPKTILGAEGSGVIIATGNAQESKALLGKVVNTTFGTYCGQKISKVQDLIVFDDPEINPKNAASCINPLTALCMLHTINTSRVKSWIHTASASQLGQMLIKHVANTPMQDQIVHIVRNPKHLALLKNLGATHVLSYEDPNFEKDLSEKVAELNISTAFDAIGGPMPEKLILCMEAGQQRIAAITSPHGTSVRKNIFSYGNLIPDPIPLSRLVGRSFSLSGWMFKEVFSTLTLQEKTTIVHALQKGMQNGTFHTQYQKKITLEDLVNLEKISTLSTLSTNGKYLISLKPKDL